MDHPNRNKTESDAGFTPDIHFGPQDEIPPAPEADDGSYVNEKIRLAYERAKTWSKNVKEAYQRSPRIQKTSYQGKFLPAFWTITAIFSLLVNIILIVVLISFGRNFFKLKALVGNGLVNGLSNNLALMDEAHIVHTVSVDTTVNIQDSLPVVFDLPLRQDTPVTLSENTQVDATTYINGALVPLSVILPSGTSLQIDMDMTIPVSQTIPVNLTVPIALQVPIDVPIDQTDLHQSIVGLQDSIEPYKALTDSMYNSPEDFSFCNHWWSAWSCDLFFGRQ